MTDFALPPDLVSNPMFWTMLAVIFVGLLPLVLYTIAVIGANVTGRSVPAFGDVLAVFAGQTRASHDQALDEVAENTRKILELLSQQMSQPDATAEAGAFSQEEEPAQDNIDDSAAWSNRRRSDRGFAARGTGYGGADPNKTYNPGTGTRAGDRQMFTDELRNALRLLDLLNGEMPDVAKLTRAYKDAAKAAHPDRGGSTETFLAVKEAYDLVLKEIGAARRGATG